VEKLHSSPSAEQKSAKNDPNHKS